jgi:hypothetical protein
MRSICIALFCTAAIVAVGFATAQADAVVAETAFVDVPPALGDEATLVETLSTSETDDQDDDHDGHDGHKKSRKKPSPPHKHHKHPWGYSKDGSDWYVFLLRCTTSTPTLPASESRSTAGMVR